ncbi:MAG: hypothetical protein M3376_05475 [Actinomycetota bacterium]|nr:hypothetical protein [Actinomycetota bacterium]
MIATLGVAAVASAAPAGGAQQATTSRPDVVSAAITDQPAITNATGTPKVKVCFDQQIANPVVANFAVSGTDVAGTGNPLAPTSAQSLPSELNCVSLTYPAGTNLAGFSTVEVQAGAVAPPGGGAGSNPQGAAALTGGDVAPAPGKTSGPNLAGVSVESVAGGTDVTYTFDKLIAQTGAGAPVAGRFGYYTPAGAPVVAASVVSVSDRAVKVKFATSVPASSRAFAANDAVTLAGQPDQGNAASATPAASGAPDLIAISRVASLQATYDLTYDANITSADGFAANCQADTPSARFPGTAAAVLSATTIRVTFGGLAANSGADFEIVRISDKGGCALENTLMTQSSVGAAPVQNKDHTPGFTSGPDLTGCSASGGGTDVTFTFDELLAPAAVAGSGFGLIDGDATRTNGTGTVLQVTDNRATVRFGSAGVLSSAVGCTVDRGAITDRRPGPEPSSLNTVKANSAGTPENARPGPPPTATPPTNPAPPTPFVKRAPRSLGISVSCRATSRGRVRCTSKGTLRMSTTLTPLGKRNICTGKVRVRYTSGRRTMSTRNTTLRRTCTYRTTVTFKATRRQRARLRVQARYGGNTVSRAKSSKKIRAKVRR